MADEQDPSTFPISDTLRDWMARHGQLVGVPFPTDPMIDDPRIPGNKKVNPDPTYRYIFTDGSVLEGNSQGQIKRASEQKPTKGDTSWSSVEWVPQADGTKIMFGFDPADQAYKQVPNAPVQPASAKTQQSPEMKQIEQNGQKVWMQRPAGSTDPNAWVNAGLPGEKVEPKKPDAPVFREYDGKLYQWLPDASITGGGTWKVSNLPEGQHPPGDFIEGGFKVHKVWNEAERKYVVDPLVDPQPWSPEAKAQSAKLAAQPKEDDTRDNIVGGYHVTQTYKGGDWTTTKIGDRATPREIAELSAPADQPFHVWRDEQGQIQQAPNPNYQGPKAPTTPGDIAQRVAGLKQQMTATRDKIAADKTLTDDQKRERWQQWYAQNVEPQKQVLTTQQDDLARAAGLEAAKAASTAYTAQGPGYGPGMADMFSQGINAVRKVAGAAPIDTSPLFTQQPNLVDYALAGVSPEAAARVGQPAPNFRGVDVYGALDASQMGFPGAPPPAPAGGPPPEVTGAAVGGPGEFPASATTPFKTFSTPPVGGGVNGTGAPIAADPMAAAFQMYQQNQAQQQPVVGPTDWAPPPQVQAAVVPSRRQTAAAPDFGGLTPGAPTVPPGPTAMGGTVPSVGYEVPSGPPTMPPTPGFGFDPSSLWSGYGPIASNWVPPVAGAPAAPAAPMPTAPPAWNAQPGWWTFGR